MKTSNEQKKKRNPERGRERERNGERKRERRREIKREIKKRWKKGTKKREDLRGREFWRNERKREEKKEGEEDLEGKGGEGADKKKRSSKLTAASGRPGATGSPFRPKTLFPSSSVFLRPPLVPSLSRFSLFPLLVPLASLRATVPPCMISLAPLEARQMSGIRLRHLSVSPSVTFDSRQIERRARQQRRGGEGAREGRKRGATFYSGDR